MHKQFFVRDMVLQLVGIEKSFLVLWLLVVWEVILVVVAGVVLGGRLVSCPWLVF